MKPNVLLLILLFSNGLNSLLSQDTSAVHWDINFISVTPWNTPDGFPYSEGPGANLGTNSFAEIDLNSTAFLCNSTGEIIITNSLDGKILKRIPIYPSSRDIEYDNGLFYVLTEKEVLVYNEFGQSINIFPYSNYFGVERMVRSDNSTYLLLPDGNSLKIESAGKSTAELYNGWVTKNGDFITTQIEGNFDFSISLNRSGEVYSTSLSLNKKIAGVYAVGSNNNRVYLDIQTFVSENPIAVERHFASLLIDSNGLGPIVTEIKAPDCYYVFSSKDIYVSPSGRLLNMITAPEGVFMFSISESNLNIKKNYPDQLQSIHYHYNYHLMNVEK